MSLNINDIDIDLFLKYFNESLLDDVQSDVVELPVEVKGYEYILNFGENMSMLYQSAVPLKMAVVDGVNKIVDAGLKEYLKYNMFSKSTTGELILKTMDDIIYPITEPTIMTLAKQLYNMEYFEKSYLKIPTYSEYCLYINKTFNKNLNFDTTMVLNNPNTFGIKIPHLEITNILNQNIIHFEDIIVGNHIDNIVQVNNVLYDMKTIFLYEGGITGTTNLKKYLHTVFTEQLIYGSHSYSVDDITFSYIFINNHIGQGNSQLDKTLSVWVKVSIENEPNFFVHIGYLAGNEKIMMPKLDSNSKPIFKDKYGIESTLSTSSTNFMNHNRSIRENVFHIAPSIDSATLNFSPNIIGMRQIGSEFFLTSTHKFEKKMKYERISKSSIPTDKNVLRTIINPEISSKITGNGFINLDTEIIRFTENVLNLTQFPRYSAFYNQDGISENEFNDRNTFYILDDIRDYRKNDVILIDCLDSTTAYRSVVKTFFAVIKDFGTMYTKNDIVKCAPPVLKLNGVTDNSGVAIKTVDLKYYLEKSNQMSSHFSYNSVNKTWIKTIYYQNSLDLSNFYSYTETWSDITINALSGYPGNANTTAIYNPLEFYNTPHLIIDAQYVDDSNNVNSGKILMSELATTYNNIIFYKKRYLGRDYHIIRYNREIPKTNQNKHILNNPEICKIINFKNGSCLTIYELIDNFNNLLHFAKDGYIEERGELLVEGISNSLDEASFIELMEDKINSTTERDLIPEILDSDTKKYSKMKVLSEGVLEYINNLGMPVNKKTNIVFEPDLLIEPKNILLIKKDTNTKLKKTAYVKNKTFKAIVSNYNKNVFQRVYNYKNYKTMKLKTDDEKNIFENRAILNDYDTIKRIRNDDLKKTIVKKKDITLTPLYETIINAVGLSFLNSINLNDNEYLTDKEYNYIMNYTFNTIEENVEEKQFVSKNDNSLGDKILVKELMDNESWSHIELDDLILDYGGDNQ